MRREDRCFSIAAAQVESRPPSWWVAIDLAKGIDPGSEESLARLRPGAALADSAVSPGGLAPDDIDFHAVTPTERRRAIKILRMLSPATGPADLEKRYTAAWLARRQAGEHRERRKQTRIVNPVRKLDFDPTHDYKQQRRRFF